MFIKKKCKNLFRKPIIVPSIKVIKKDNPSEETKQEVPSKKNKGKENKETIKKTPEIKEQANTISSIAEKAKLENNQTEK